MNGMVRIVTCGLLVAWTAGLFAADGPKDLNPVTFKASPTHDPIVLVKDGKPLATICVMGPRSTQLNGSIANLQTFIKDATGATLPIVDGKITTPAIVIGNCDLARANGLDGKNMPIEGFAVKTIKDHVFIVGHDANIVDTRIRSDGTAWGIHEFLERFVGVRWYYPGELGQSVPKATTLQISPVWLEDAPVFRKREIWPPSGNPWNGTGTPLMPVQTFLRSGNSWPNLLVVHSPDWSKVKEYTEKRPEIYQLRSDGTRDFSMLCYAHPKTLATYMENVDGHYKGKAPASIGIVGDAVTVSPADAEIACYAPESRKLWDPKGGMYGSGSKIVGKFAADLGRELGKKYPGKTVLYLPYLNYTLAPEGVEFPNNVEVQICGMPGLAQHKEPEIARTEQENIDRWVKLTGRKVQGWHYSCWPEDRTKVAYLFPHTIKTFYQANRDKTVGTFINGTFDHWPRQHISLYCWMKVLWNPDFDVDAAIEEYCRRMGGPAAATIKELVKLQIDRWEQSRWPGGRMSAKGLHEVSFPRKIVEQMEALLKKAQDEAAGDPMASKRVAYFATPFAEFFKESRDYHSGTGFRPLLAQKVGENPKIDGKLDDEVWKRAQELPFVLGWDKTKKAPLYPTTVKAVWTAEGVTFGFRLNEPTPDRLERGIKGRDDSMAWWDDNIEMLFDVTGKNEGEFYHFIYNPNAAVADAKGRDFSWNSDAIKAATFIGKDFWSLEVFVPYAAFPEAAKPGSGSNTAWFGNFTRHRVADQGLKPKINMANPDSKREYQRMNTNFAGPSNNLSDFAQIKFVE